VQDYGNESKSVTITETAGQPATQRRQSSRIVLVCLLIVFGWCLVVTAHILPNMTDDALLPLHCGSQFVALIDWGGFLLLYRAHRHF
jgi:hypothetical protein